MPWDDLDGKESSGRYHGRNRRRADREIPTGASWLLSLVERFFSVWRGTLALAVFAKHF